MFQTPTSNLPKPGQFYYHFKSTGGNDHLYKIVGLARHTETDEMMVIYEALYQNDWIKEAKTQLSARPLNMFVEEVDRDGYKGPRFKLIEDEQIIAELKQTPLYNNQFLDE